MLKDVAKVVVQHSHILMASTLKKVYRIGLAIPDEERTGQEMG
jgi:hypothetical protein